MSQERYSTAQRLALAMVCLGFVLCAVGGVAPYWMTSEFTASDASLGLGGKILGGILDNVNLIDINLGVWVFCIEYLGRSTTCYNLYTPREETSLAIVGDDEKDVFAWIQLVRVAVAVNILLGLACGLAACCRCMCASGGKTVCHGITAFLSGGSGVFAFAVMIARKEDLVPGIFFIEIELAWSLYVYASGSCLLVLASFLLCSSVPDVTNNGVVMPMPMTTGYPMMIQNPTVVTVPVAHQIQQQQPSQPPQPQLQQFEAPQQQPPPQTPLPASVPFQEPLYPPVPDKY